MTDEKINILPLWLRVININLGVAMIILSGLAIFNNYFIGSIKLILLAIILLLLSLTLIANGIFTRFFSYGLMILNITSGSVILALGVTTIVLLHLQIDLSIILLLIGLLIHAVTRITMAASKIGLPLKIKIFQGLTGAVLILLSLVIILGVKWESETLLGLTFLTVGLEKTFIGIQGYYIK
ncbi:MAG: hypothetical protein ACTSWX_09180 [Promethearchaeota archaeon]